MSDIIRPFQIMTKAAGASCNMRCDYCYYLEKENLNPTHKQISQMSGEVLEAFIRSYIQGQPEGAPVLFTWHGGEALLRPKSFYEEALRLQAKYAEGRPIENSLQTNGLLLTEDWCRFFRDNNFLIGISLDGNEKQHDAFRRTLGGQGSFSGVMRGLNLLQRHGVEYNILSTINSHNANEPLEYYRFIKGIGAKYIQFTPIVERIHEASNRYEHIDAPYIDLKAELRQMHDGLGVRMAPYSVRPSQWGDFLCMLFDEWVRQDVGEVFVQIFDATLAGWMGVMPGACTLAPQCGHAGIIEHNGDVFSCDHYVYHRYKLGNVLNRELSDMMMRERQQTFGEAKRLGLTEQCRSCTYLHLCHGECPKNRFGRSRDGEPGHNYLCSGYYTFWEYSAPYMDYMRRCLMLEQPPSLIMDRLAKGLPL